MLPDTKVTFPSVRSRQQSLQSSIESLSGSRPINTQDIRPQRLQRIQISGVPGFGAGGPPRHRWQARHWFGGSGERGRRGVRSTR